VTKRFLLRKVLLATVIAPLMMLLFVTSLTFSMSLPNAPIAKNILERESVLLDRRADNGRVIDADTECIGLSVGVYRASDTPQSAFERSLHAESVYGCDDFMQWLKVEKIIAHRDYFRYWHGQSVISRPLLSVLPYNDLRGLLFTVSIVLLGILVWRLGCDFSPLTGLAFLLPFLVLNAMGFWVVVTKAVTWFLIIGGALFFSRRITKAPPLISFFVLGGLTAFFDFLTTPILVFALSAIVYLMYQGAGSARSRWTDLLAIGIFWCAGYLGLWAGKFVLAAIILDLPVWEDVASAAAFRIRGASEHVETFLPGAAIYQNFAALKTIWGVVAILLFIVGSLWSKQRRLAWVRLWREGGIFIAIATIPLLWLEVMSNHSQIHAAFTHLNFAPAAILACMVLTRQTAFLCKTDDVMDKGSVVLRAAR